MVTSNAYRMTASQAGADANRRIDPDNRFYWHLTPIRMEAQLVRDTLLALAGELDPAMGGPSIDAKNESSRRRSLYFVHSHNDHHKFLSIFDDANVLDCYRRAESIVPQQALALSNSALALGTATKLRDRLAQHADDAAFIRAAFGLILGNTPSPEELAACQDTLGRLQQTLTAAKHPAPGPRAREVLVHALLNHNDFIMRR
jgi:hypothetical protein